jgi:hypothetical protein
VIVNVAEVRMRMIIEARLIGDAEARDPIVFGTVERLGGHVDAIGLSLAEGRALLASAQQFLVRAQCRAITAAHVPCVQCNKKLATKGWHQCQIRTVFGCVLAPSPRVRCCACQGERPGASFSPLADALPMQMTPELEYLQVKWSAHLPFAAAAALLNEVLPIGDAISITGMKRRVRAVGVGRRGRRLVCI